MGALITVIAETPGANSTAAGPMTLAVPVGVLIVVIRRLVGRLASPPRPHLTRVHVG